MKKIHKINKFLLFHNGLTKYSHSPWTCKRPIQNDRDVTDHVCSISFPKLQLPLNIYQNFITYYVKAAPLD